MATRASKTAEATLKQVAALELQVEKDRMEEWKENVMQEVAREVQVIKLALEKTWDARPKTGARYSTRETTTGRIEDKRTRGRDKIFKGAKANSKTGTCLKHTCRGKGLASTV